MPRISNHLLPKFILRNWVLSNARLFDKKSQQIRKIKKEDFAIKYYYSLGKKDDALEIRISRFETSVGIIIKKLKEAGNSVLLTGKEIEMLKLFCVLAACRQHNTSPVILNDDSGIYHNNQYIFGTPLVKDQKNAVNLTSKIIDDFERLLSLPNDAYFETWSGSIKRGTNNSIFCQGMHLAIIKSMANNIMISDICAIIECTMDSDYLYTYVPISPQIALLIVKSKYYKTLEDFEFTKVRFGEKYWSGAPDPWLSAVFNDETVLFDTCYRQNLYVTRIPTTVDVKSYKSAHILIRTCSESVFRRFNSIIYQDGKLIVYCHNGDFEKSKENFMMRNVDFPF